MGTYTRRTAGKWLRGSFARAQAISASSRSSTRSFIPRVNAAVQVGFGTDGDAGFAPISREVSFNMAASQTGDSVLGCEHRYR
jgi:hypothetical protein